MRRTNPDSMPMRRAAAVVAVNEHFNRLATQNVHRDQAHARKRAAAASLLAGGEAYPEFHEEALLRGVSPTALAIEIAGKSDATAARELQRQQMMHAIEAAKTPDELPTL